VLFGLALPFTMASISANIRCSSSPELTAPHGGPGNPVLGSLLIEPCSPGIQQPQRIAEVVVVRGGLLTRRPIKARLDRHALPHP
jgi:hypothetical protein